MSPATIFDIHLVLGYVPWLLCFGAYVWPRLKSMDRVEALLIDWIPRYWAAGKTYLTVAFGCTGGRHHMADG